MERNPVDLNEMCLERNPLWGPHHTETKSLSVRVSESLLALCGLNHRGFDVMMSLCGECGDFPIFRSSDLPFTVSLQ